MDTIRSAGVCPPRDPDRTGGHSREHQEKDRRTAVSYFYLCGYGEQNIYRIILKGKRDPHTVFDVNRMTGKANILEISDETSPAYDLRRLYHENEDTVLGRFMEQFAGCEEGSTEYQALCEGVDALMKSME